jgi:hypothetical protein
MQVIERLPMDLFEEDDECGTGFAWRDQHHVGRHMIRPENRKI